MNNTIININNAVMNTAFYFKKLKINEVKKFMRDNNIKEVEVEVWIEEDCEVSHIEVKTIEL